MILYLILCCLGFALLIKGADWLVDGASALAIRFKVAPIVIGLTIVAFGTSSPELAVNIMAAAKGQSLVCFGNIIGSNIVNILLILGLAAVITPLATGSQTVWKEIPFAITAVLALAFLLMDEPQAAPMLNRADGLLLLLFFAIFLTYVFGVAQTNSKDEISYQILSPIKTILFIILGFVCLIIGAKLVVDNAINLARIFHISEKIISITIISIGTSLPELVTTVMAALKKQMDIAIGTVVGSNIANILLILGVSALVRPLPYNISLNSDFTILIVASFLLFLFMFTGKRRIIDRWEAVLFLVIYVCYTVYLITE